MRTRRFVAALVLAMLPVFAAVSMTPRDPLPTNSTDWAYAVGMGREEAAAFAIGGLIMCSLIPNPGAFACGLVGIG